MSNMEVQIIKTNKGKVKIAVDNFLYYRSKDLAAGIRWECCRRQHDRCKAAVKTNFNMTNPVLLGDHTHNSHPSEIEIAKCRQEMKERAKNSREKPKQIVASAIARLDEDARSIIGSVDTLRRDIQRHQRSARPTDPTSLSSLVIPEDFKVTNDEDPRQFLIHDSGNGVRQRLVIFATESSLRVLASASTWFMDGNFSMAPVIFSQIYVIRVPFSESAITCVYSFLPGKGQVVYEELFRAVMTKCENLGFNLNPTIIITDFEMAVMQACRTVFGAQIQNHGCFFHLTQATWRKVTSLGLIEIYKQREDIKLFCGMMDGLAFLPPADIPVGMEFLKGNVPEELEELLTYFDTTYVSGTAREIQPPAVHPHLPLPPVVTIRTPPLFPPPVWNVREITLNDGHRTNNICEAWNIGYQNLVGHKHPSLWSSIEAIKMDEALCHTAILQNSIGIPLKKKSSHELSNYKED